MIVYIHGTHEIINTSLKGRLGGTCKKYMYRRFTTPNM